MKQKTLQITNLGMNFEGIARDEGKVYFVPFSLPGEKVKVDVVEEKAKFNNCKLLDMVTPSKERVNPFCPYFTKCGGCDMQHMLYSSQLLYKKRHVEETLNKIIGVNLPVLDVVASKNSFYYRNKASFAVSNNIGMFEMSSHNVLDIKQCYLMHDNVTTAYQITKQFILDSKLEGFDFKTNKGNIKYIVIRSINNTTLVCLVLRKKIDKLNNLYSLLKEKLENVGLYINYNNSKSQILTANFEHIAGEKTISLHEFDINYSIDIASFMQVNDDVKQKLYSQVLNEVEDKVVIDAYAGAGLLSAIMAKRAKKVYSVEIVKPATEACKKLIKQNNISNLEAINGDCGKILPTITKNIKNFITVIDPARAGCDENVLQAISKSDKIIYISCNPITLAKDLKLLLNNFNVEKVQPFDMFPQAKHVETMVVLTHK